MYTEINNKVWLGALYKGEFFLWYNPWPNHKKIVENDFLESNFYTQTLVKHSNIETTVDTSKITLS